MSGDAHPLGRLALLLAYGPEIRAFLYSGLADALREHFEIVLICARPDSPALRREWGFPVLPMPLQLDDARLLRLAEWRRKQPGWKANAIMRCERAAGALLAPAREWRTLFGRERIAGILTGGYDDARFSAALRAACRLRLPAFALANSWKDVAARPRCPWPLARVGLWTSSAVRRFRGANAHLPSTTGFACGSLHLTAFLRQPAAAHCWQLVRRGGGRNLDPRRPLVVYCAANPASFPGETALVERLAAAVAGGAIPSRPQLIIRANPMENGERFQALEARFPETALQRPKWDWDSSCAWNAPHHEDMPLWRSLVTHAAAAVMAPSTAALEFAAAGRPVVAVDFPPHRCKQEGFLRELTVRGGLRRAESFPHLLEQLHGALREDSGEQRLREAAIRRWLAPQLSVETAAQAVFSGFLAARGLSRTAHSLPAHGPMAAESGPVST